MVCRSSWQTINLTNAQSSLIICEGCVIPQIFVFAYNQGLLSNLLNDLLKFDIYKLQVVTYWKSAKDSNLAFYSKVCQSQKCLANTHLQIVGFPSQIQKAYFLCMVTVQRRQWHPTLVLLPGKSHGRRSLVGCSPWGRKESDNWVTSLSLFTFMHWRRKWQPTPVFLPGESQGRGSLVGCRLWGCTESDTTEAT